VKTVVTYFTHKRSDWLLEMDKLLNGKVIKGDVQKLEEIVDWFCQNIKDQHTPRVRCARKFRQRIEAIIDAMDRKGGPRVIPSAKAVDIAERLYPLGWPGDSKANLPEAVERFGQRYDLVRKKIIQIISMKPESEFYMRVKARFVTHPEEFVIRWFTDILGRKKASTKWDGKFGKRELFDINHELFTRQGEELSTKFGGNTKDWNAFYTLLQEQT